MKVVSVFCRKFRKYRTKMLLLYYHPKVIVFIVHWYRYYVTMPALSTYIFIKYILI